MRWNERGNLKGLHAPLSPSQNSWVNYDEERLMQYIANMKAKEKGTLDHEFASYAIKNRYKMSGHKKTINMFINDCIGFFMESEQTLFYSENCFGTADAINYNEQTKILKIFDLKTGTSRVTFTQLQIYAALFCLEYNKNPYDLTFELRIYKQDEIFIDFPDPLLIQNLMDTIVHHDRLITGLKV